MSLQLPPSQDVIVPHSWVAKILKIPIFRLTLGNDLISRIIIWIHNVFLRLCWLRGVTFFNFDPVRAQKSVDRFIALGARIHFVTPQDGRGSIQMMTFRAADLETTIQKLGGRWERQQLQGKTVFAIIPPNNPSKEWNAFKEQLTHFHWPEQNGMLITCDCADVIPPDAQPQCFLYTHSTSSSFASDWRRAGFYIGAKQDLCFFDNGNTWKNNNRPPSEESFYTEIDTVYDQLQQTHPYSMDRLWVGGTCNGAPIAAYLKRRFHHQGVNFFAEQSFSDLNDVVQPIFPFLAPFVKGSLNDHTQPLSTPTHTALPRCQFGVAQLWQDLAQQPGKIIFVQVRDDEHISTEAYQRYLDLARRVNQNVTHILFSSNAKYRHADDFFRHSDAGRTFMQGVFQQRSLAIV